MRWKNVKKERKVFVISKQGIIYFILVSVLFVLTLQVVQPRVKNVFQATVAKTERKLPIYCVDIPEKKVSISFDAAWGADDTDELLKILKDNNVKATFFMCGYWVEKYPEEVKKIAADGHDLGNHSATHAHMNKLSKEEIKKEIQDAHETVKQLTGQNMDLFRPPFGEYDNKVIEAAQESNYYTIQWDVEPLVSCKVQILFNML